jgi:DNA polymerase-3 subunit gamma/tau
MINKYRPPDLESFLGNSTIKKSLQTSFDNKALPHAILFIGESGCGKTTLAQIISNMLKCKTSAYYEVNCTATGGKEKTLQLIDKMKINPLFSPVSVFVLDEAQGLTADSQEALLKPTETPNSNTYVIFCSTNPSKIKKTLRNRFTKYQVNSLSQSDTIKLITKIWTNENYPTNDKDTHLKIIELIAKKSVGVPREALTLLSQLRTLDLKEVKEILQNYTIEEVEIIDIAKKMIKNTPWFTIANIYIKLQKEGKNPETIRITLGKYFKAVLLKNPSDKLFKLTKLFSTSVDSNLGDIELVSKLYEGCQL